MNVEDYRIYCLRKKGVEECFPFDSTTLVFKVMGKMFALTGLDNEEFKVNLKCDPERAIELRDEYPEVLEGWHMSKKHWNTVICEGDLPEKLICEMIDHSYELVVAKLTKKLQAELEQM